MPIWCRLFRQVVASPAALARLNAGNSSAARMEMIEITTSSSISVKALLGPVLRNSDFGFRTSPLTVLRLSPLATFFSMLMRLTIASCGRFAWTSAALPAAAPAPLWFRRSLTIERLQPDAPHLRLQLGAQHGRCVWVVGVPASLVGR